MLSQKNEVSNRWELRTWRAEERQECYRLCSSLTSLWASLNPREWNQKVEERVSDAGSISNDRTCDNSGAVRSIGRSRHSPGVSQRRARTTRSALCSSVPLFYRYKVQNEHVERTVLWICPSNTDINWVHSDWSPFTPHSSISHFSFPVISLHYRFMRCPLDWKLVSYR